MAQHNVDHDAVLDAYQNVRKDSTDEIWVLFGYNDSDKIVPFKSGKEYDQMVQEFDDNKRMYGFVRFETGDELSKRAKFVFITWVGENVSPMKKAKVSTDKGSVKAIVQNFAVEIFTSDKCDLEHDSVKAQVVKVGGANYGTGK